MSDSWPDWMYVMKPFDSAVPISAIKRAISETFDVHPNDLVSHKRARKFVYPRQAAMALASTLTKQSLPQIGRSFGRDHTTVMHAQKEVRKRLEADPVFREQVQHARTKVMEMLNHDAEVDDLAEILMSRLRDRLKREIEAHPEKVIRRLLGEVF